MLRGVEQIVAVGSHRSSILGCIFDVWGEPAKTEAEISLNSYHCKCFEPAAFQRCVTDCGGSVTAKRSLKPACRPLLSDSVHWFLRAGCRRHCACLGAQGRGMPCLSATPAREHRHEGDDLTALAILNPNHGKEGSMNSAKLTCFKSAPFPAGEPSRGRRRSRHPPLCVSSCARLQMNSKPAARLAEIGSIPKRPRA